MDRRIALLIVLLCSLTLLLAAVSCGEAEKKPEIKQPVKPAEPEKPAANPDEMVFIPAGECIIGGSFDEVVTKPSSPPHKVDVAAFWLDRYEVTFEEFMEFTAETGFEAQGNWRQFYSLDNAGTPVFNITLDDAKDYAKWVGKRLPTQEEWEKAASWDEAAQKQRRFPWGDEWKDSASNTAETTYGKPVDIGEYEGDVSFYGVNDMLGNVYEWTDSFYTKYKKSKFKDPNYRLKLIAVKGAQFGIQGKVWYLSARSAFPKNSITAQGFRCARDADPGDEEQYAETVKSGTPVIQVWKKPAEPVESE